MPLFCHSIRESKGEAKTSAFFPGLNVRNGWTFSLLELHFGTKHQRAEQKISERHYHVEILMHVTMMQEMMTIEAIEDPGLLDVAFLRKVHAPMHILVSPVVDDE